MVRENTFSRKGGLWEFYMAENIPHIRENWKRYQQGIKDMNNGKQEGRNLWIPDLDNNDSRSVKYK